VTSICFAAIRGSTSQLTEGAWGAMGIDAFRFDGKRVLVVGGATGMGAAAATIAHDLGAEVIVMDYAPVSATNVKAITVDLRDRASTDAAIDACGGPVHAILSCAGVADGTPGIEKVNFIAQRHLIERMIGEGMLPRGSAIAMISSVAGLGWDHLAPDLIEFLETPDFDTAAAWIDAHPGTATYVWAKQAMCAYVARQAYPFQRKGVRINAILPGPTDTPLARANAETWLGFATDYRAEVGLEPSTPEEQAYPLVFLCSAAASYVNGQNIITDAGYVSAGFTNAYEPASFIRMMMGR
jgi:NAD(P)-dependent dehydrogenase (short-subunit alcohol dehydrogenase family)